MDHSFRLDSQPWQNEPEPMICTCCQGVGVHETYNPNGDCWLVDDCISCAGTGYITRDRSNELEEASENWTEEDIR